MYKCYCDACSEEVSGAPNVLKYKCHIDTLVKEGSWRGYVDMAGNDVSGREEHVDLCNRCYNEVLVEAITKVQEIQEQDDGN